MYNSESVNNRKI